MSASRRIPSPTFRDTRARRAGVSLSTADRPALLWLMRGLVITVLLTGMCLIMAGMWSAFTDYAEGAALLASENGPSGGGADVLALARAAPAAPEEEGWGFMPILFDRDAGQGGAPALAPGAAAAVAAEAGAAEAGVKDTGAEEAAKPLKAEETPTVAPTPPLPGPPERISIARIALDAPVALAPLRTIWIGDQSFEQLQAPDSFAGGWLSGSAQAGEAGNTVITGHHNIAGSVFARLHELVPGDQITLFSGESTYVYTVRQVLTLQERGVSLEQRQENASWILPSTDERLTLVTCWPAQSNTHRLIVVAAVE